MSSSGCQGAGLGFNPELALVAAVLLVALAGFRFRLRWLGWWERPLELLARRKRLAIAVVAVAPLALRVLLLPLFPVPEPRVHDEFAYLLAADTLVHQRLVNPRHPSWVHFESMHILSTPVYASAFPIAQAAVLALGQVVFGHPWAGIWLSAGLMSAAICWMLQGWVPPPWALLGAGLAVLRYGVSSYWMNSYWGGCLAATGGALVLGALPRILRQPVWRNTVPMGLGLALLANTRPVEGAFFGLIVGVALLARILRIRRLSPVTILRHVLLPLAAILAATAAGMGYYFARVTGKPWLPPYVWYRTTLTKAPHFLWQDPRPEPLYNNREMRQFYLAREMHDYQTARTAPLNALGQKAGTYWRFYLGPLLAVPLLWRSRKQRGLLIMAAAFPLILVVQVWHYAHYAAPAAGLVLLIVTLALRRLRALRWRRPLGLNLARSVPLACAAMLLVQIAAGSLPSDCVQQGWRWPSPLGLKRASIRKQLESSAGKHVVFVRYGALHDPGDEWVYNSADLDSAPVVWARELDAFSNAKLTRYYAGRKFWLVEPDLPSPRLAPFESAPVRPMPFVPLGAPGIETLHNPEAVRNAVLQKAMAPEDTPLGCDAWNYYFTKATGVLGPDPTKGCYPGTVRSQPVRFRDWFAWVSRQR